MFCGALTNFRGCKFWMLNGKKGKCVGVIDFSGAVDAVASMGKRVFFKWTMAISKSNLERIGTLYWLQIREVEVVKSMQCNCYFV